MALSGKKARKREKEEEVPSASQAVVRQLQSLRHQPDEEAEVLPVPAGQEPVERILRSSMVVVLLKNFSLFLLLAPTAVGECQEERLCMPVISMLILFIDLSVCTGHLMLGFFDSSYRHDFLSNHFWLMTVLWSIWNVLSHPFWRENTIDIFIVWPEELHTVLNMVTVLALSFTQTMPSWRHTAGLVMGEFFLSLALSAAEVSSRLVEALDAESPTVRFDLVIFNIAILIIGCTMALGSLDHKDAMDADSLSLTSSLRSQAFEDDLERRKRAVLTALCDTVLTTNAHCAITLSNDAADKLFKRPMLHEFFTDYFRDRAEKAKFLAAMKKQFSQDASKDGPKRLRVILRDASNKPFEADVVVSDASTDMRTGKVTKLMVGMHVRPERLEKRGPWRKAEPASATPPLNRSALRRVLQEKPNGAMKGEEQRQSHREFSKELFSMCVGLLRNGSGPKGSQSPTGEGVPRIRLHRSNYESFRRRSQSSTSS